MMRKLINTNNNYYIIDDSELNPGDWCLTHLNYPEIFGYDFRAAYTREQISRCKKITHSTEILEGVGLLHQHDIDTIINGYALNKLASEYLDKLTAEDKKEKENTGQSVVLTLRTYRERRCQTNGFIEGFEAHRELTKDKLYTFEDIEKAFWAYYDAERKDEQITFEQFFKTLTKTEWEIKTSDNG